MGLASPWTSAPCPLLDSVSDVSSMPTSLDVLSQPAANLCRRTFLRCIMYLSVYAFLMYVSCTCIRQPVCFIFLMIYFSIKFMDTSLIIWIKVWQICKKKYNTLTQNSTASNYTTKHERKTPRSREKYTLYTTYVDSRKIHTQSRSRRHARNNK